MDPKPASSSSYFNGFKRLLSCGSLPGNSCQPKRRQQSDHDVPRGLVDDNSMPFKQFDIVDDNSMPFKQFDIVANCPDHHFASITQVRKPTNVWTKKIQQEWMILKDNLPETIFVRIYEERMDLLRAVIVGPAGTPYQDGLFFFDFQYTANYPNVPPNAHYHSSGLHLNPNLYPDGKVCLSLLNTWLGEDCEKWNPKSSTMLQILVSIQGLVLNAKPYFNEPGLAMTSNTPDGDMKSLAYNDSTFLLSCRTMICSLRRPPEDFAELVTYHFGKHGLSILMACRAYSNGTQVACVAGETEQDMMGGTKGCSNGFQDKMKWIISELLKEFEAKGVDCSEFLIQKSNDGDMSALPNNVNSNVEYVTLEEVATQHIEANSNLKRFFRYLLKLGKKVLPIEN